MGSGLAVGCGLAVGRFISDGLTVGRGVSSGLTVGGRISIGLGVGGGVCSSLELGKGDLGRLTIEGGVCCGLQLGDGDSGAQLDLISPSFSSYSGTIKLLPISVCHDHQEKGWSCIRAFSFVLVKLQRWI